MVPMVRTRVCQKSIEHRSNISKRLEIRNIASTGNQWASGRCQHRRHHGTMVYYQWYGSNSTAMSAARISTTILATMWACTRTSACIASLRTVSVVVRAAGSTGGRPGWALARLARKPSELEPVTGHFVDTSTCLQDKRDEVVLVGVLRRFDRGRRQSRCPGRHSAGSRGTPRRRRGSACCRAC